MLIRFSEKEGIVDYKLLLESYKVRDKRIDSHPIRALRYEEVPYLQCEWVSRFNILMIDINTGWMNILIYFI